MQKTQELGVTQQTPRLESDNVEDDGGGDDHNEGVPLSDPQSDWALSIVILIITLFCHGGWMIQRNRWNAVFFPLLYLPIMAAYLLFWVQCKDPSSAWRKVMNLQMNVDPTLIPASIFSSVMSFSFTMGIPLYIFICLPMSKLFLMAMNELNSLETGIKKSPMILNPWSHLIFVLCSSIITVTLTQILIVLILWGAARFGIQKEPQSLKHAQTYLCLGLAIGLGVGTGTAVIHVCYMQLDLSPEYQLIHAVGGLLNTIPVHCMFGLLWGIGLARKRLLDDPQTQRNWLSVGLIPCISHGLYCVLIREFLLLVDLCDVIPYLSVVLAFCLCWTLGFFVVVIHQQFLKEVRKKQESKQHTDDQGRSVNMQEGHKTTV